MTATTLGAIIVVDDNVNDLLAVLRALSKAGGPGPVVTFESVNATKEFLTKILKARKFGPGPWPRIVLVNLKMLGTSGFDFLRWAKDRGGHERTADRGPRRCS